MSENESHDAPAPAEPKKEARGGWTELVAVLLLSVSAILTAWAAFESSKWGGAMSISFSQASTQRIEASRFSDKADSRQGVQVDLFTQWVQAKGAGEEETADFLEARFPEPLRTAYTDWLATNPLAAGAPPTSPFEMPSYKIPERAEAEAADARADAKFSQALRNNQRGDNYTLLTVLFAAVLFFAAMAERLGASWARYSMLGLASVLMVVGIVLLASFPKLV